MKPGNLFESGANTGSNFLTLDDERETKKNFLAHSLEFRGVRLLL